MSRLRKQFVVAVSLTALVICTLAADSRAGRGDELSKAQLPPGNWTLRAHPYLGAGYDSIPVFAWSVTTDSSEGLNVKKVGILNRSREEVKGVKLAWTLTESGKPGAILRKGETPLIILPKALATGESANLKYSLVAFKDISKPLLKDGHLTGNFIIEVVVSEIRYANETSWSASDVGRPAFVKTSSAAPLLPLVRQNDCRYDECDYMGGGRCGQTNQFLNCLVCGPSCTTYSCYGGQPVCDQ